MTLIRAFVLGVLVLVGTAATANASLLTLNFSGSVDLSGAGGTADNPFSGFFTWDTTQPPAGTDGPNVGFFGLVDYHIEINGFVPDPALGAGVILANDGDLFGTGTIGDALVFYAPLMNGVTIGGVTGDLAFVGALAGPSTLWNGLSLPTDYAFLSQISSRFSGVSLEVPFEGDANDVSLGTGSFDVRPVPEPASLTLTAIGLAGAIARGRRSRQQA